MRAVTIIGGPGEQRFAIGEFDEPTPDVGEVVVAVKAISLNNGEVRGALSAPAGYRPGWDLEGHVEAAPRGSGFSVGERVVGLKFEGAWAERVAVPPEFLGSLPDDVGFEAASVLPVAGMTATLALSKKRLAPGSRVLVTAATGGVGMLAIQLAAAAGAQVTAFVRRAEDARSLEGLGAQFVAIGEAQAAAHGPFDLILEGVGGGLLGRALSWLSSGGVCVQFGDAGGDELTTFNAKSFRLGPGGMFGGTSLYGFFLGEELTRPGGPSARKILTGLADSLRTGQLHPAISATASWRDVNEMSRSLLSRRFKGKAVLRID